MRDKGKHALVKRITSGKLAWLFWGLPGETGRQPSSSVPLVFT